MVRPPTRRTCASRGAAGVLPPSNRRVAVSDSTSAASCLVSPASDST
jgi:hypothetical protein